MCIVVRQFVVFAGLLALPITSSVAAIIITGSTFPADVAGDEDAIAVTGVTVGGNFSAAGDGTLAIGDGTTLTVNTNPYVNIAPLFGSNGSITVSGAGSTLRLEGADQADPANGAFMTIGRGGTGTLTVGDGASVEIDSLGTPLSRGQTTLGFPAGFNVGRDAGSVGTVNLTGSGSAFRVTSDFAVGFIGREGTGVMNVTNGASLIFEGKNSDLNVSSDLFSSATGTRHGTLNVNSGGRVSGSVFLDVGGSPGGTGIVNLSGATSSISLIGACSADCPVGFSAPNQGAFMTIGANRGTGLVNISDGAKLTIDSSGTPGARNAGFALGGSSILGPMGNGTLNVVGEGSELRVIGDQSRFIVGRLENGTGTLNISNGGRVVLENNDGLSRGFVGDRPGAVGTINVTGENSLLDAGNLLGVGVAGANSSAGGNGTVWLIAQATVLADHINIGADGWIKGSGTLASSTGDMTQVRLGPEGHIDPGLSIGEITIKGDLTFAGGTMIIEANSMSDVDRVNILGDLMLFDGFIDILLGFVPGPDDVLEFLTVGGVVQLADTFGGIRAFATAGSDAVGTFLRVLIGDNQFSAKVVAVPEPANLALLFIALLALAVCSPGGRVRKPRLAIASLRGR